MRLRNDRHHYGLISIALHWLCAIAIIALLATGLWMVELDYYDPLYHPMPAWHKAVGLITGALLVVRWAWSALQAPPTPLGIHRWQNRAAHGMHIALMLASVVMVVSGYLISTAKGAGIDVFGLLEVPALLGGDAMRGEWAGRIHAWLGIALIAAIVLHALAALKHHLIDRDHTLTRMIKPGGKHP